jgi:hypothetical protein
MCRESLDADRVEEERMKGKGMKNKWFMPDLKDSRGHRCCGAQTGCRGADGKTGIKFKILLWFMT